jgi:diketogulonate reductase-like aldo/keto reductase
MEKLVDSGLVKYIGVSNFSTEELREVQKTMAQVALNWCTARPNVIAIPKSNSLARTIENCHASGWRLSQSQIRLLDEAFS